MDNINPHSRSAREKLRDNWLSNNDITTIKYGRYRDTPYYMNRTAIYRLNKGKEGNPWLEKATFKDLMEDDKILLLSDFVRRDAEINKSLKLAISTVLDCLYSHCPVDTGFGITTIRYNRTVTGASIIIGKGIAEYLVHLAYPRLGNIRGESSDYKGWIDRALAEARAEVKGYGFKIMKDHLSFGAMTIYLVAFNSGARTIMNGYKIAGGE